MRKASLALLLFLVIAPGQADSLDQLTDAFIEIAGKSEFKVEKRGQYVGITKWSIPIKFNVVGATSVDLVKEVEAQMARLAQLSHLDIELSPGFVLNAKGERESIDDVHTLSDKFDFASMREDSLRRGVLVNALVDKKGLVARGWLGNFTIVFGKRSLLGRIFDQLIFDKTFRVEFATGKIGCFSTITIPEGSRDPRLAIVLIPTDQDAWFVRRCIVEETTQALG